MDFEKFYEIIAVLFYDGMMIFGQPAIDRLKTGEGYKQLLSREEFYALTRFDLGEKWAKYADEMPVIIRLHKDTPMAVRAPGLVYKWPCA